MKKILFVVDELKMGGVSIVLENIFKAFPNVTFDLLSLHNSGDKCKNLKNVNVIFGSSIFEACDINFKKIIKQKNCKLFLKKVYLILLMKTNLIKYKIKKERKKILSHVYDIEISFKDGIGTFFVAYGNSAKKIRWLHSDYSINNPGKNYKKNYKKAIKKYDKIIAISETIANNFNKIYKLESKTDVIYNIIDIKKSLPTIKQKKENYNIELVTVGRLVNIPKGYDRVIKTIGRLNDEGLFNNCVFKIVGDGPDKKELENLVESLNLQNKVIFFGESETPWNFLQNGDLFVMSSLYEAFPTTIIESLINHIPVFSVKYSSVYETLNHNNAIIVENDDESIYCGLKEIINGKYNYKSLKKNLKNYKYDNKKSINQLKKLLEIEVNNIE